MVASLKSASPAWETSRRTSKHRAIRGLRSRLCKTCACVSSQSGRLRRMTCVTPVLHGFAKLHAHSDEVQLVTPTTSLEQLVMVVFMDCSGGGNVITLYGCVTTAILHQRDTWQSASAFLPRQQKLRSQLWQKLAVVPCREVRHKIVL